MDDKDLYNQLFNSPDDSSINIKQKKNLARSENDVIVAGVCSGIANYFSIDKTTLRILFLLTLLFSLWFAVSYLIAAFLLPIESPKEELSLEELENLKSSNSRTMLGGMLILTGIHFAFAEFGIVSNARIFLSPNGIIFPILVLTFSIFLIAKKRKSTALIKSPINFTKANNRRLFLGVCSGLAKYLNIDVVLLRITFLLLTFLTLGMFSLVYLIMAIYLKRSPQAPLDNE